MYNGFEVIDGHIHTFSSEEVSRKIIDSFNKAYDIVFDNPGTGTIENVIYNMEVSGVDFSVMANFAPPSIIHKNNLWTLEVAGNDTKLIPLVSFHPGMPDNICDSFRQYMEMGAKGVKLHPMAQGFSPDEDILDEVYSLCAEHRLPVVFHCGRVANARLNEYSDIGLLLHIAAKYPSVPFVMTHMADGNAEDVIRTSYTYKNVFFDTSIVITGYEPLLSTNEPSWRDDREVAEVIRAIGADKVVFGSDYPWGSPKHDIIRINGLSLGQDEKKLIFSENAKRLFGI